MTLSPATKTRLYWAIGIVLSVAVLVWFFNFIAGYGQSAQNSFVDPVKGATTPTVVIEEYSDFQCPSCKKMYPLLDQLLEDYGDKLAIHYNDFPLTQVHANSFIAAEAGQCALAQDAFWEYHDMLFDRQTSWESARTPEALFADYATELGLDRSQFESCLSGHITSDAVSADIQEGRSKRISSTPTLLINGERYAGVGSYDSLKEAVNKQLQ